MEEIIAQINSWEYLGTLPAEINGYHLVKELEQCGPIYRIFSYENQQQRRKCSIVYEDATKEFFVRITIGLTEFCDISFIVGNIETFEQMLRNRLQERLSELSVFDEGTFDSLFIEKKVVEWGKSKELPSEIDGFFLYIHPGEPVKIINGSYIVIDYCDFSAESNLVIYYNIFRDEFFGELRIRKTPQMAAEFDSKTLNELDDNLDTHLYKKLDYIRKQL